MVGEETVGCHAGRALPSAPSFRPSYPLGHMVRVSSLTPTTTACSATATTILTVQAAGEDSFLGAAIGDELRRQVAAPDPGQQAALRFLSRQIQADALPVGGCVLS